MVALLETRMSSHLPLKDGFNFSNMLEVPAQGQSRGIVILWDNNIINMTLISCSNQEIHAMLKVLPNHEPWLFSIVYASTIFNNRLTLWNSLKTIANSYKGSWFLGGDFNDILSQDEKWGGRVINHARVSPFLSYINHCNLIDLGFKGPKYTWSNLRQRSSGLILEGLDRCFSNNLWLEKYPNTSVTHLPRIYSDHNPLLINFNNISRRSSQKNFKLETYWFSHPNFGKIVQDNW